MRPAHPVCPRRPVAAHNTYWVGCRGTSQGQDGLACRLTRTKGPPCHRIVAKPRCPRRHWRWGTERSGGFPLSCLQLACEGTVPLAQHDTAAIWGLHKEVSFELWLQLDGRLFRILLQGAANFPSLAVQKVGCGWGCPPRTSRSSNCQDHHGQTRGEHKQESTPRTDGGGQREATSGCRVGKDYRAQGHRPASSNDHRNTGRGHGRRGTMARVLRAGLGKCAASTSRTFQNVHPDELRSLRPGADLPLEIVLSLRTHTGTSGLGQQPATRPGSWWLSPASHLRGPVTSSGNCRFLR